MLVVSARHLDCDIMESIFEVGSKLWSHTYIFIIVNRSSTKALKGTTPFEAFIGQTLVVSCLKVFGSITYAHRKKLDSKSL